MQREREKGIIIKWWEVGGEGLVWDLRVFVVERETRHEKDEYFFRCF